MADFITILQDIRGTGEDINKPGDKSNADLPVSKESGGIWQRLKDKEENVKYIHGKTEEIRNEIYGTDPDNPGSDTVLSEIRDKHNIVVAKSNNVDEKKEDFDNKYKKITGNDPEANDGKGDGWYYRIDDAETKMHPHYEAIDNLNNIKDDITSVNSISSKVSSVSDHIAEVTNVNDNISKITTVNDNMSNIVNVNSIITKVTNLDNNMSKIVNVDDNMSKIIKIYNDEDYIINVSNNIDNPNSNLNKALEHANAAEASKNKAAEWAEKADEVEGGQYSAKHWAKKAFDVVNDGLIDDGSKSDIATHSSEYTENSDIALRQLIDVNSLNKFGFKYETSFSLGSGDNSINVEQDINDDSITIDEENNKFILNNIGKYSFNIVWTIKSTTDDSRDIKFQLKDKDGNTINEYVKNGNVLKKDKVRKYIQSIVINNTEPGYEILFNINMSESGYDFVKLNTYGVSDVRLKNISDIQDNLTSDDINKPLSAKQGKILDNKIDDNVGTLDNKIDDEVNTLNSKIDEVSTSNNFSYYFY